MRQVITGFLPPLYNDGQIDQRNLQAITLRNAGSATVSLQNGMYTLSPGESVSLSAIDNADELVVDMMMVSFDTATGPVKKLEILTLRVNQNAC